MLSTSCSIASLVPKPGLKSLRPSRATNRSIQAIASPNFYSMSSTTLHPDAMRREMERQRRAADRRAHSAAISQGMGWWTLQKPHTGNMVEARTPADLRSLISESAHRLVVVDFFSPECNACRALYPKLVQIATHNPSVLLVKVNCGQPEMDAIRAALEIPLLPFFVFYKNGEVLDQFSASLHPGKLQRLRMTITSHGEMGGDGASLERA